MERVEKVTAKFLGGVNLSLVSSSKIDVAAFTRMGARIRDVHMSASIGMEFRGIGNRAVLETGSFQLSLTCFYASFFPLCPLAGHPSSSPFLGAFLLLSPP